jgi:hypothetical protein
MPKRRDRPPSIRPQLEDRQYNFLVIDLVERKGDKRKQTVPVKCTKIIGFWLRNSSALVGAERKLTAAQSQKLPRSKIATSYGWTASIWTRFLAMEGWFGELLRLVKTAYAKFFLSQFRE